MVEISWLVGLAAVGIAMQMALLLVELTGGRQHRNLEPFKRTVLMITGVLLMALVSVLIGISLAPKLGAHLGLTLATSVFSLVLLAALSLHFLWLMQWLAKRLREHDRSTLLARAQTRARYQKLIESLEARVQQSQSIVRDIHYGVITVDASGKITSFNPAAEVIFGWQPSEVIGRPVQALFQSERQVRAADKPWLFGMFPVDEPLEIIGKHKNNADISLRVVVSEGRVQNTEQYTFALRLSQDQAPIAEQLFNEQERALVTLGSIADGVITTDNQGAITYLNPSAERLTGWPLVEAKGTPFEKVYLAIMDGERCQGLLNKVLGGLVLEETVHQVTLLGRDGIEHAITHTLSPIKDKMGRISGAVAVFHDVSSARAIQQKLSYQATHDDLTGVLNRHGFEAKAQALISRSVHNHEQHMLGFIDLDSFKAVNDACGHQVGDELLQQISQLIKRQLRSDDVLARLGGDEFGLLLNNCDEANGLRITQIICDAINAYRFIHGDQQFNIGASIGLVKIDREVQSLQKLISLADSACYQAKAQGRNRVNLYRASEVELAERRGQTEWLRRIRQALEDNKLRLYSQPIVPVAANTGGEQHVEIFVRMLADNGKLLPPGAFIPSAERFNLIQDIDRWVVTSTLEWLREQREKGHGAIVCSLNLSGASLSDKNWLEEIINTIDTYQVPAKSLCFEITETAAIANLDAAKRFISALKEKGCRFSLDDFGSGLSSFSYLKHLPVDYLKIDGVFIKDIASNSIDRIMVQSINSLGHELGLQTVAEYVESKEAFEVLRELGVDFAQGYFIAEPEALGEI